MKRIVVTLLIVMLGTTAVLAQNKNTKSAKPKAPAADCSTATDARITEDVKAKLQNAVAKRADYQCQHKRRDRHSHWFGKDSNTKRHRDETGQARSLR